MATLQETVQAVLAELQKQGINLQNTDIAKDVSQFSLVLGFKANGSFVRIPTNVLQQNNTMYLTKDEYQELVNANKIRDDIEYNIYENE